MQIRLCSCARPRGPSVVPMFNQSRSFVFVLNLDNYARVAFAMTSGHACKGIGRPTPLPRHRYDPQIVRSRSETPLSKASAIPVSTCRVHPRVCVHKACTRARETRLRAKAKVYGVNVPGCRLEKIVNTCMYVCMYVCMYRAQNGSQDRLEKLSYFSSI